LKVLDTGEVLYNVLAVGIPHVDAVSETGAIVYRHFSLLQSSSASRFTAAQAGFFDLSSPASGHCDKRDPSRAGL
jgi:hypothetical protein